MVNNLQMRFFKVMLGGDCYAIMADADEAGRVAKRVGGDVLEVTNIKIAKIFARWS